MKHPKVAVLGAGSWGTALAKLLADKGFETRLWSRREDQARAIQEKRVNEDYLPGAVLPPTLTATHDLERALAGADLVVVVVPTVGLREVLDQAVPLFPKGAPIVSATKGIEEGTLKLVSEIFEEHLPPEEHGRLTYLGGPSFAKEVADRVPTVVCVAGRDEATVKRVQDWFWTDRFRVYRTDDVIGVELGGALKNVIAIAAGVADGMGLGHNSRAGLITRGLAEITRLAVARGGHPLTLSGLSGMGDLVLTCTGHLSRNRQVGVKLGQGMKLSEILGSMNMVAEGVKTSKSAYELGLREDVDMPITREVYLLLYHDKPAEEVVETLMMRPLRAERG
ncbi:MAG: NAD(P)-dependent glycerol-3-phosphate dehydrogenase [Myxococcales bacterium]|nr:NAD(P)-dependent glycerol-3-phosphate dehydrogenase [Myxococcales bacterium]